jgi:hypothetical protein
VGEVFVVNASPVITLAKAGHLALLTDLADTILLPAAVVGEVLAGPESDPARRALEGGWGRRVPVSSMPSMVVEWGLGAGEADVQLCSMTRRDGSVHARCAFLSLGRWGWCYGPNVWEGSRLQPRC